MMDLSFFPPLNAGLNGLAGIFLLFGYLAIKRGERKTHQKFMLLALCSSGLFLVSYLTYHALSPGVTKYQGQGILRGVYFFVLLTHTPLAAVVVPASLLALWHAIRGHFQKHVKITRWLFPVWGYVSITGVVIYLMLYVF